MGLVEKLNGVYWQADEVLASDVASFIPKNSGLGALVSLPFFTGSMVLGPNLGEFFPLNFYWYGVAGFDFFSMWQSCMWSVKEQSKRESCRRYSLANQKYRLSTLLVGTSLAGLCFFDVARAGFTVPEGLVEKVEFASSFILLSASQFAKSSECDAVLERYEKRKALE